MKPGVVVDIGNSRLKAGRVSGDSVVTSIDLPNDDPDAWTHQLAGWRNGDHPWIIASVAPRITKRFQDWLAEHKIPFMLLENRTILASATGFRTQVENPDQIGTDRLLNALAAHYFANREVAQPHGAVAISVGTAQTVDFVDSDGTHIGGAILPGPDLMARSLHEATALLPIVTVHRYLPVQLAALNTQDALRLGISRACVHAADGLIQSWIDPCRPFSIFVTGGGYGLFRDFLFQGHWTEVVLEPRLTLEGIRLAAQALP